MRRTMILGTVLFGLVSTLFPVPQASAATFYVSPNGNNSTGDGSAGKPWATLSHACSRVRNSGNTISIGAGSYVDSSQCNLAVGVNISGAGKAQTIIVSNLNDWYILANSNPIVDSRQTISGFTLDGNNRTLAHGICIIGRNFVTVDNVAFVHIRATALKLEGYDWWRGADQESPAVPPPGYATGCILSNLTIIGCSDVNYQAAVWAQSIRDTLIDNIVVDESAGTGGRGNALKSWPGWINHCTIRNSTFTVNPATSMDAITIELWNLERDTEIHNNTFNEGYVSLVSGRKNGGTWSLRFHDNRLINTSPLGYAHELAVDDTDFYGNYIVKESLGVWPASHMYNLDGMGNIRIHHNVIYSTKGQGIAIQNVPASVPLYDVHVYNNVVDTTDGRWPNAGVSVSASQPVENLRVVNNIFSNLAVGVYLRSSAAWIRNSVIRYNDFNSVSNFVQNEGATNPAIGSNVSVDPQFVKMGERPEYYKLAPSSPLIDAGTDVGLPFLGAAPCIGAFESGGLVPPEDLRVIP